MNKKVFVVLVTYNGAHWIDKNIQSLLHSQYPVSIIAIDNNSTDDSAPLLAKYPEVDLIKSPDNLGFGKANNIGMKKALEHGADYVFLLNQDAWVFEDTINSLIARMDNHDNFGIMSPMHYSGDGVTLDKSFETYYKRKTGLISGDIAVVSFVNAAAWMLNRKCIEKVGYFEPLFGHYGEDRNYCDRVRYHKFEIGIDPDSRIVHDRVITRNFKKDSIQSKYKILTSLLDINNELSKSYIQGLKEVFGLPKYFSKSYGAGKSASMFFTLLKYYLQWIGKIGKIKTARNNAK
ncbi:glycosyltransferase family 2 protein [Flavobacterium sp. NRK1]|uniref:glycosyltransferase family 2 protein n=1 Tax=Flavobacterium sp. NRK1 TaxID=2954929 RepID=UPI002092850B|nr:glycosyltransferase family 2 protein [Flavobacterium sp. NRK1]MCO6147004.1 glycosyltransferase family 2 protein [Flavobacterium sp. NRK1]